MRFAHTVEGKNVFLPVDNRVTQHNPFYKAWKAKSFTDKDITLHFILFDSLHTPGIRLTLQELIERIDRDDLSAFETPMAFDESTVRKKLKEYADEGLIVCEKQGRQVLYGCAPDIPLAGLGDLLDYFSEAAPCGVAGSYLLDQLALAENPEETSEAKPEESLAMKPEANPKVKEDIFSFEHHYITGTLDSEILAVLFCAMREKRYILADNFGRHARGPQRRRLVPLRVYSSVQNGRQHLLAYNEEKTSCLPAGSII